MNREEYGNFHYGFVGVSMGIPEDVLILGSIYAHYTSHGNLDDDPHDLDLIRAGIDYFYKIEDTINIGTFY